MILFRIITLSALVIGLTNCQSLWQGSSSNPNQSWKNGLYTNSITHTARKINANYAREYNLSGNVIAIYPDFQLQLVSTEIKGNETISLFEITSKNGLEKSHLRCSTADPEKKHLYIEDMHFFYHSNEPGKINLYFPPMLMASQHLQPNNTL